MSISGQRPFLQRTLLQLHAVVLLPLAAAIPQAAHADSKLDLSAYIIYDYNAFNGDLFADENAVNRRVSQLRRLKASAKYDFKSYLSGKLSVEYDAADDKFGIDDAYIDIEIGKHWHLQAGKFKEPFGLENQQSLSTQYTMERSAPTNALTFGRNHGLLVIYQRSRWQWQFATTKVNAEDNEFKDSISLTTRLSGLPVETKDTFVHLGAGYTTRNATEKKYDIDEGLIAHGVGNLISSANLKPDTIASSNIELAAKYSAFILQSESIRQYITERNGDKHTLSGYYATLLWTVLGSKRDYDNGEIKFDDSSQHTVELAIRRSYIDLESDLDGDRAKILSAAVNYYFKSALRISLEYQYAELTSFDEGETEMVDGEAINARLQLNF